MSFAGDSQQAPPANNQQQIQQDNQVVAPVNQQPLMQQNSNGMPNGSNIQSNGMSNGIQNGIPNGVQNGVANGLVNSMSQLSVSNGGMQQSDQPQESKVDKDARTIFLRNISFQATVDNLKQVPQFAHSSHINISVDKETARSKGYGFIEFASAKECQDAIQLCNNQGGVELLGRQLVIQQSDRAQHAKNNHNQTNNYNNRNNYQTNGFRGGHNNSGSNFRGGRGGGFRGGRGSFNNGGYQNRGGNRSTSYNTNYNNFSNNPPQANYGNYQQPPTNYGGNFSANNNFQAPPPQQNYGGQFNAHAQPSQPSYAGHPQQGNFAPPANNYAPPPQQNGYAQQTQFGGQFQ